MKHNLVRPLVNYKNAPFTRQVEEDGVMKVVPMNLQDILEQACINANPQKYASGDKKMQIYKLLRKVSAADPTADLTVEEVAMLKELIGDQMTVAAVGAVFEMLENPLSVVRNESAS